MLNEFADTFSRRLSFECEMRPIPLYSASTSSVFELGLSYAGGALLDRTLQSLFVAPLYLAFTLGIREGCGR